MPRMSSPRSEPLPVDPEALFVYGTLQFPEVLAALIGRVPDHEAAAAEGWRSAPLQGRPYPGLVPDQCTARGHQLAGLTAEERHLLDAFEGPMYALKQLDLLDGRRAWAYVWNDTTTAIKPGHWSPERFQQQHLPAYVEYCTAWRHGKGD